MEPPNAPSSGSEGLGGEGSNIISEDEDILDSLDPIALSPGNNKSTTWGIVAGTVASVVGLVLCMLGCIFFCDSRNQRRLAKWPQQQLTLPEGASKTNSSAPWARTASQLRDVDEWAMRTASWARRHVPRPSMLPSLRPSRISIRVSTPRARHPAECVEIVISAQSSPQSQLPPDPIPPGELDFSPQAAFSPQLSLESPAPSLPSPMSQPPSKLKRMQSVEM